MEAILIEVGEVSVDYVHANWSNEWDAAKQNCSFVYGKLEFGASVIINCSTLHFGNFVRISKLKGDAVTTLSVCEVEIKGYKKYEPSCHRKANIVQKIHIICQPVIIQY